MSKFWSTVSKLVGFVLAFAAFQNCGGNAVSTQNGAQPANLNSQSLTMSGTVTKANLDGCSYLICSIDNTTGKTTCFIPKDIDPSLLNDGNVVNIDGTIRTDLMTTCMAGPVLQVTNASLVTGSTTTAQ